ncbi:MAG: Trigger factor [bacterium ADurb.Bin212]|nr:MAG: Trigger factor [bacterium ADurb.Bin212]
MKIDREDLKKSKVKLTVELEPKELAEHFRSVYNRLSKGVKVDGFRAGKAPYKMVEGVLGYNKLLSEGLDEALNMSYQIAVGKEKLFPVSPPSVSIKKTPGFALDETDILDKLIFEIEVDVMPEVKLKDYSKAKVTVPKKRKAEDEEVQKILDQLMKQKATFKDRVGEIKDGDRIDISYEGYIKHVKIDKMCSKNHPLILGENTLIPGFEKNLVGMEKGQNKEFKIVFPKDYHDKEVAGKEAKFVVTLNDAKEVVLPKLDKSFSEQFGHDSVDKLKTEIKKSLEIEVDKEYKEKLESLVLEKMVGYIETELPDGLVDQEVDRILDGYREQIEKYNIKFEQYLQNSKKDIDSLRQEMRGQAEKNVKVGLLLGKIIEEQKIDHKSKEAGKKALEYLVKKLTK